MLKTFLSLLISAVVLVLGFQNCGTGTSQHNNGSFMVASGSCEAPLMNAFGNSYYTFFKQKCVRCHESGPGLGFFASNQFSTAFQAFNSLGRARVEKNLLNPAHQASITGPQNQPLVDRNAAMWIKAESDYKTCAQANGIPIEGDRILTVHKANDMILAQKTQKNPWVKLSWDLEKEMSLSAYQGKYKMTATLDVRFADLPTPHYEFRNPTLKLNAGASDMYLVTSLYISFNGYVINDVTTYSLLQPTIFKTTETNIASGASYPIFVHDNPETTDSFALSFGNIKVTTELPVVPLPPTPPVPEPLPTNITHTELISNTTTVGIFKNACLRCHGATVQSAGLNFTNYTMASGAIVKIVERMNNSGNPMPPSGILSKRDRDLVKLWQTLSTPP